jgi:hypothetical protein
MQPDSYEFGISPDGERRIFWALFNRTGKPETYSGSPV